MITEITIAGLRRSFLVLSSSVLAAVLLSGCGGVVSGLDSDDTQTVTDTPDNSPDNSPDEGVDSGSDVDNDVDDSPEVGGRVFNHPGVITSQADLDRMRTKVAQKEEPWYSAWEVMSTDSLTNLGRWPRPLETLDRGGAQSNYGRIYGEIWTTHQSALAWYVTGDDAYAEQAIRYLNIWASVMTGVAGNTNVSLLALYSYQLAESAEIMRSYEGWAPEDQQRVKDWFVNVWYPINDYFLSRGGRCVSHYWANWGLANVASAMAIGIFADNEKIYNKGLNILYNGLGAEALDQLLYRRHPGNMGQYQESGRDQGHASLGYALYGAIAKMALNQGDDIFAYNNYELLATTEYIAKYNSGEEVPYVTYDNCDNVNQTQISGGARGIYRNGWNLLANQYENRLGIAAPWTRKKADEIFPEFRGGADELAYGGLTETLEPYPLGGAPRGLTPTIRDGEISLSWWGATGSERYTLKRAESAEGPYSDIVTRGAEELLTYTDLDVENGKQYFYHVTAISPVGESEPSNMVAVTAGHDLRYHLTFDDLDEGTTDGVFGKALVLDGIDDYYTIDKPDLVSGLGDFTLAGWVKADTDRGWQRMIDIGADDQRFMTLVPFGVDRQACFIIAKVGTFGTYYVEKATQVCGGHPVVGEWTHLAITLKGKTSVLYVNGEEVAREEATRFIPDQLGILDQIWVGRSQYGNDPLLAGQVDDIRLYSGALTADELKALYVAGTL
ncbi:MAG: alginate lyase family protein [Reinekea sp.]